MLEQIRVQASQSLVVPLLGEDIRLEPMQRRRERDACVSPLPGRQHSERRIFSEPLGVVRVFVPRQATIDRLPKQVGDGELAVAPRCEDR